MDKRPTSAAGMTPVLLGLGSNQCHGTHGKPDAVLRAAAKALEAAGVTQGRMSRLISTAPLGPSSRRYANGAYAGVWQGTPAELLATIKGIERDFGRKRGRRWGARVLDIDILAFGEQQVVIKGLQVPHPRLQERLFVLTPMLDLWPQWRHPRLGLTVRQMFSRLNKRKIAANV